MFPTFHQQNTMPCAQGDLKHRLGEEQPFWGDAAGVALPGVEQTSLSTSVLPRAERSIHQKTQRVGLEKVNQMLCRLSRPSEFPTLPVLSNVSTGLVLWRTIRRPSDAGSSQTICSEVTFCKWIPLFFSFLFFFLKSRNVSQRAANTDDRTLWPTQ